MAPRARWWLEWEFWAVLLLTGLIYGSRLGETPPSGEEPRRGQVAREMIASGDWIVPRQQGLPFLSRPPVQNWAIAAGLAGAGKDRCRGDPLPQRGGGPLDRDFDLRLRPHVSLAARRAVRHGRLSHDGPGAAVRLAG